MPTGPPEMPASEHPGIRVHSGAVCGRRARKGQTWRAASIGSDRCGSVSQGAGTGWSPLTCRPCTPPSSGASASSNSAAASLAEPGLRLLTITGPGGVGKTRLALRAASAAADDFTDGVGFVSLGAVRDDSLVPATIAQVLGIVGPPDPSQSEALVVLLRDRRLLLVLDGMEHLPGSVPLVVALIEGCPGLTLLVTSRSRLHVSAEHQLQLDPLDVRGPGAAGHRDADASGAVRLFCDRAASARPGFSLDDTDRSTVAAICRHLDGLPLALELAAARMQVLSAQELLARLEQHLPALAEGPRDGPARHRTMQAAISWSYDLLAPERQRLLRRLAVFDGGVGLEGAEAIDRDGTRAGTIIDDLTAVADLNLVRVVPSVGGAARFAMLETVREFLLERLLESGEEALVRDRHAAVASGSGREGGARLPWSRRPAVLAGHPGAGARQPARRPGLGHPGP